MRSSGMFASALLASLGAGCGLATHVRPVPRGALAVEASAGGPALVLGGAPIPLPLSAVGASYGVADNADVHAHTHLTTLAAFRVAGFDVGATWMPVRERRFRPAVALTARGYAFTDFASGTLFFADATVTASYLFARRFLTFATFTALLDVLNGTLSLSPGVGEQVQLGRVALGLEMRWYDPAYRSASSPANPLGIAGQGALGAVLSASYRFGGPAP